MTATATRAARWIFADKLPTLCIGDMTRDRRRYDGEQGEITPWSTVDFHSPDFREMWYVTDVTRNGWITLERNVRRPSGIWEETGEVRRIRGRKNLTQYIVALTSDDFRFRNEWAI
ncbi:hypothetical protein ACPCBF_25060 [Streptomyces pseudogriseolus]|uniref:hypothetical protein n=1 Tax=Streptomyces pseudogriseolus TaxID=36817 RepID=UPI003FA2E665